MVRYKTETDDREQRVLAEISLNTPVNRKKRKSTVMVSVILSVIYAAFSAWLFARGVKANGFTSWLCAGFSADSAVSKEVSAFYSPAAHEKEKQGVGGQNSGICYRRRRR